jgi:hypothetical protein
MEPEADADHRYWACTTCGYEAGYEKAQSSTACATGQVQNFDTPVPVSVPLGMPGRRPDQ